MDVLTTDEFKHWIEGYGIEHRQAGGDPTALMKLSAEHKVIMLLIPLTEDVLSWLLQGNSRVVPTVAR
jgi:hypothetical protein